MPNRKIETEAPEFGKRLVKLLGDCGVPRRGAGAYLQRKYRVSNVTANDWLNGKFRPGHDVARKIALDHGTTFDALYFGADGGKAPSPKPADAPALVDLQQDYRAISVALGALAATMVQHRPAEAAEAADALQATVPRDLRDHDLIRALGEVLEQAKGSGRRTSRRAS